MTILEEAYQHPGCSVLTFGGEVVISLVRTEMTIEGLAASVNAARRLALRNRHGVGSLAVVAPNVSMPGPELRHAINQAIKDSRQYTCCAAQVLRGTGFWLSAVRSLLTAIELIHPGDLPRRTFDDVPIAARWIAENLKHDKAWADQLIGSIRSVLGTGELQIASAS
jgi:hypothetical protein